MIKGKIYKIELCEVSKEIAALSREEKEMLLTTSKGVFDGKDIFLNHESIIVTPTDSPNTVREYFTGKEIPYASLDIYSEDNREPYGRFLNGNFKQPVFGFQIRYIETAVKAENRPFNGQEMTKDDLIKFIKEKGISCKEYERYLNERLEIEKPTVKNTFGQSLKKIMRFKSTKK